MSVFELGRLPRNVSEARGKQRWHTVPEWCVKLFTFIVHSIDLSMTVTINVVKENKTTSSGVLEV